MERKTALELITGLAVVSLVVWLIVWIITKD